MIWIESDHSKWAEINYESDRLLQIMIWIESLIKWINTHIDIKHPVNFEIKWDIDCRDELSDYKCATLKSENSEE